MKKLLILTILISFALVSCSDLDSNELNDMTNTFKSYEEAWDKCNSAKECLEVNLNLGTYLNHPDNQDTLLKCVDDGDCYTAMMAISKKLLTQMDKLFSLSEEEAKK
jgi:hypothetical protein